MTTAPDTTPSIAVPHSPELEVDVLLAAVENPDRRWMFERLTPDDFWQHRDLYVRVKAELPTLHVFTAARLAVLDKAANPAWFETPGEPDPVHRPAAAVERLRALTEERASLRDALDIIERYRQVAA